MAQYTINPDTGEVSISYDSQLEHSIFSHVDYVVLVNFLVEHRGRMLTGAFTYDDILDQGFDGDMRYIDDAHERLLGREVKRTWKDFQ